jgi:signal transduction histidine kinase/ActR/RegA family two-component response regulator
MLLPPSSTLDPAPFPGPAEGPETEIFHHLILDTLDHSNVLLWWARVRKDGPYFTWTFRTPPQLKDNRTFRLADRAKDGALWSDQQAPDRARTNATAAKALTGGAAGYQQEFRIVGNDKVHWLSEEVTIRPEGPNEWNLAGVVVDVTERRQMEEQLQHAVKMESIGVLAGGIAHDFNNILTVILSNLTLLQMDLEGNADAVGPLSDAVRATNRASELTHQLLTFSKGGDPIRTAVNLAQMIREIVTFATRGSRTSVEFELAPDLWAADVDRGQISRVVENLVINATQAMPHGGTVRLRASNRKISSGQRSSLLEGNYVHLTIEDTGDGIPPENLHKIFEPYFTTKSHGNGLGLAIVFSIVHKHHGDISVRSTPGCGTTFEIWLPAAAGASEPAAAPREFFKTAERTTVLFMDDEEPITKIAKRLLQRMGLECECVSDGDSAVQRYRQALEAGRPFGLVILDLTVPGKKGGKDVIASLVALNPQVRAIVSTGYSSDMSTADFRRHGFKAMVAKPYNASDFAAAVRSVLEAAA